MKDEKLIIALIEDNEMLAENTQAYLALKDIWVYVYECVEDYEQRDNLEISVQLLLVDINLPWKSGTEFLKEIRSVGNDIPFILITSMNTTTNIVEGLELGADDYVSKPFNFEELVARIKMVIARKGNRNNQKKIVLHLKEEVIIEIDREYKKVKKNGENIYLPTLEYGLLNYFLENRWKIIPRNELYEEVWWEFDKYQLSRTVDVYIGYLRKKLWKDVIITKKGDWYYID